MFSLSELPKIDINFISLYYISTDLRCQELFFKTPKVVRAGGRRETRPVKV